MIKRKKLFTIFAVLLTVFWFLPQPVVQGEILPQGVTISVIQDEEVLVPVTAVSFAEGETAFDILQKVAEVDYTETDYGPFITGINGVQPEGEDYWGFFINGQEAQVGAADYQLQNGDHLLFKVTSFPPETIKVTVSARDLDGNAVIHPVEVEIVKGATALDALVVAASKNNIPVDVSVDSEWLTFLNDIDDRVHEKNAYWASFINDEYMTTGLVQYMMQEGDHLQLKMEAVEKQPGAGENAAQAPIEINEDTIRQAIAGATNFLETEDRFDWYGILALKKLGKDLPDEWFEKTLQSIQEANGKYANVTDVAKHILIVTAFGKTATDIEGIDLIDVVTNHEGMTQQGNNGPIYSLLALDSGNYETGDHTKWSREALIDLILEAQLPDGSWALTGNTGSADMTGIALAALAPYQDDERVKTALEKAYQWIRDHMSDEGGFYDEYSDGYPSESIAQVIIGLIATGEDPAGEAFTKNGINLVQALLTFQTEAGGFRHLQTDEEDNPLATNQALLALAAFQEKVSVFDFHEHATHGANDTSNPFAVIWIISSVVLFIIIIGIVLLAKRKA